MTFIYYCSIIVYKKSKTKAFQKIQKGADYMIKKLYVVDIKKALEITKKYYKGFVYCMNENFCIFRTENNIIIELKRF